MRRLVSILHLVVGLACSALALPFIQLFLFDPGISAGIRADGQTFLLLSLVYFWPSIVLGLWGLLHFRSARWPLAALAGLYLLLFPLGTILGVMTLLVTFYPAGGDAVAKAEGRRIGGVLFAMGATGSTMVLSLAALFLFNRTPLPEELAMAALPAGIILPLSLWVLLKRVDWSRALPDAHFSQRQWRIDEALRLKREAERLERLRADPLTMHYAEAMDRGEYWSDEAIAYDRNPEALVTEPALQPIEAAMRQAGVAVRYRFPGIITADCRIDAERLYAQFPPRGAYAYSDTYRFERSYDPDEAVIIATSGMSYIHVVHPRHGNAAPLFPPTLS